MPPACGRWPTRRRTWRGTWPPRAACRTPLTRKPCWTRPACRRARASWPRPVNRRRARWPSRWPMTTRCLKRAPAAQLGALETGWRRDFPRQAGRQCAANGARGDRRLAGGAAPGLCAAKARRLRPAGRPPARPAPPPRSRNRAGDGARRRVSQPGEKQHRSAHHAPGLHGRGKRLAAPVRRQRRGPARRRPGAGRGARTAGAKPGAGRCRTGGRARPRWPAWSTTQQRRCWRCHRRQRPPPCATHATPACKRRR